MDDFQLSDKQLKKILDIKSDLYRYIENNLWIRTKSGKLERLVPNKPQKALIDYVLYCLELGIPVRVILWGFQPSLRPYVTGGHQLININLPLLLDTRTPQQRTFI